MFVYLLLWEEYKYSIGETNKCSDSNFVKSIIMSINGSTSNLTLLLNWSRYIFFALNYKLLLLWRWWWHDLDRFKDHLLKRDLFMKQNYYRHDQCFYSNLVHFLFLLNYNQINGQNDVNGKMNTAHLSIVLF